MNAFDAAKRIERKAMEAILTLIRSHALDGRLVVLENGTVAPYLQSEYGDVFFTCKRGKLWTVEIKVEQTERTGNFFLETWSNRSRAKFGWMYRLKVDLLLYYFLEQHHLFCLRFPKLKSWFLQQQHRFPEKKQTKYTQRNDTWGVCVPIAVVEAEVGYTTHYLSDPAVVRSVA